MDRLDIEIKESQSLSIGSEKDNEGLVLLEVWGGDYECVEINEQQADEIIAHLQKVFKKVPAELMNDQLATITAKHYKVKKDGE